jgi:hypothetical protein
LFSTRSQKVPNTGLIQEKKKKQGKKGIKKYFSVYAVSGVYSGPWDLSTAKWGSDMPGESKLERKLKSHVEALGGACVKVGHSGWPDRAVVLPGGKIIWVELKNPDGSGRVSPLQQHRIDTLIALGHDARVVSQEADFPC